ncbi:hypothetical protein AB0K48_53245, partial [Nonomuraea sp. NPDC055795]
MPAGGVAGAVTSVYFACVSGPSEPNPSPTIRMGAFVESMTILLQMAEIAGWRGEHARELDLT